MKFTYKNIIEIHNEIAKEYKISPVYFNINTIKSITYRMDDNFNNKDMHPTIYDKGALLFERIINCHPFIDGNKRTALASLEVYLFINNIIFLIFPSDVRFSVEVAKSVLNKNTENGLKNIKRWIMFHSANINDKKLIESVFEKQINIVDNIIKIAKSRNMPEIIDKTYNYWFATDIYPDYTPSSIDLRELMTKQIKNDKMLLNKLLNKRS